MTGEEYRNAILERLTKRDSQTGLYVELIQTNVRQSDAVISLRKQNDGMSLELNKLRRENDDMRIKLESGGGEKSERVAILEQKLFRAQEELTEVHRTKGANAQQLINLNLALQETEKEKNVANDTIEKKVKELESIQQELEDIKGKYAESQKSNQVIKDEHDALLLLCNQTEIKLRDCQSENSEMEKQLLDLKRFQAEQIEHERTSHNKLMEMVRPTQISSTPESNVNGSPPSTAGSPQKTTTDRSFFQRASQRASQIFGIKPTVQSPSAESTPERVTQHQGCLYVKLPHRARCKWKAHDGEVTSVKFSLSGEVLATGGSDKLIKIWSAVGDKCILEHTLRGSNGGITCIDFDAHEQLLIACSNDYAIRLFALPIQRLKLTLTGHAGKVLAARYLSYGSKMVSGSNDRTVKIWDLKGGSCVKTYLAGSSCNDVVTTDQSGECVASGHFDKKLRFYDTRSGSSTNFEITVSGRITSLDTPLDKNTILCCTKDHALEIVDLRKRTVLKSFQNDLFRVATDHSRCAYSPNADYVAAGSSDGTVLVWNALTGDIETTIHEHNDPILSCSWNGGSLLTGDKGKNCILWTDT